MYSFYKFICRLPSVQDAHGDQFTVPVEVKHWEEPVVPIAVQFDWTLDRQQLSGNNFLHFKTVSSFHRRIIICLIWCGQMDSGTCL